MTLKLAKHVEKDAGLHGDAINELRKWLEEYSAAPARVSKYELAELMINEEYTCLKITKHELAKLMEAAFREGYYNGQGDICEDPDRMWKTSNTLKALIDDAP